VVLPQSVAKIALINEGSNVAGDESWTGVVDSGVIIRVCLQSVSDWTASPAGVVMLADLSVSIRCSIASQM